MKKRFISILFAFAVIVFFVNINSCRKNELVGVNKNYTASFTEDFDTFGNLAIKGWLFVDVSGNVSVPWKSGGSDGKTTSGGSFPAYSYKSFPGEYVYTRFTLSAIAVNVSSWMISPVINMKNGDKISFYTRRDTGSSYADRLQVRLNTTNTSADVGYNSESVAQFTTLLADINSAMSSPGYPSDWTKYEFTLSGLNGVVKGRVGLRYYMPQVQFSNGIGVDYFQYQSN